MGLASKMAAASPQPGAYGGAPPSGYQGGPPPAGQPPAPLQPGQKPPGGAYPGQSQYQPYPGAQGQAPPLQPTPSPQPPYPTSSPQPQFQQQQQSPHPGSAMSPVPPSPGSPFPGPNQDPRQSPYPPQSPYGQPPPGQQAYGRPPPPPPRPYGTPPQPQQYGAPPQQPQYGGHPPQPQYGGPPQQQPPYGGHPQQQQPYGASPQQQQFGQQYPQQYPSPQQPYSQNPPYAYQGQPPGQPPSGQYPPQGGQGYPPQGGPPQGAPQGAPPGAPPGPQQAAAYKQVLMGTIQEKQLQNMYPPNSPAIDQIVSRVTNQVDQLCATWRVPREVGQDIVKLALFDVILYIDDSGSMLFEENGERIKDLKLILSRVAYAASLFDDDGIQVRFMNSNEQGDNIRSEAQVDSLIQRIQFKGLTPMGTNLKNKVLEPLVLSPARAGQLRKPVLVITITDGQPAGEPQGAVEESIRYATSELQRNQRYGRGAVSFQFAQVGNDLKAREFLGKLDEQAGIGELIDCTSNFEVEQDEMSRANPPVDLTPELWLIKMILGAIDSSYDTKDEKTNRQSGGAPPQGQYGAPPPGQYGAPPPGQYGGPPPGGPGGYPGGPPPPQQQQQQQGGYGGYPPQGGGYGQPPQGGPPYPGGPPPQQGGYGQPPPPPRY